MGRKGSRISCEKDLEWRTEINLSPSESPQNGINMMVICSNEKEIIVIF